MYQGLLRGMTTVAIKIVSSKSAEQQARFLREIAILRACHDPHIVRFLGAHVRQHVMLLAMEYMPGGDLYRAIARDHAGSFRWYSRWAHCPALFQPYSALFSLPRYPSSLP